MALIGRALRRHRGVLLRGYPLIVLWQLCETLVPVAIGLVVDIGIRDPELGTFALCLLGLAALCLTLGLSYRFGSRQVVAGLELESHLLRTEVADRVLDRRGTRTDLLPGEVLSLATSDASQVPLVFRQLGFAVASGLSIIAVAGYLLVVDVVVGLVVLVGVPVVVLITQTVSPVIARRMTAQQERTAAATGLAADLVHGLRPLKGIGGEDVASRRYRRASRDAAGATISVARAWGALMGVTIGLSGVLLAAVTVLAGLRALDGDLTVGQLIAIVGITQFLAEPIGYLGDLSAQFAGSRASAQRIATFLGSEPLVSTGDEHPRGDRRLHLDDVGVGPLLGVDLTADSGEVIGVVVDDPGVSDALVALLAAEITPTSGSATFGDAALHRLDLDARRSSLLVASHQANVPEGTLRTIVDPGGHLDAAALDEALRAACADDVVALHPDGLDRTVRAEGSTLSGGQRQRLMLARALGADAPVLVLQDPTSAVDAVTEHKIARGITRLRRRPDRTTVILTSSPALLREADRVVVVDGGRVRTAGRHDDLVDDAAYREAVLR